MSNDSFCKEEENLADLSFLLAITKISNGSIFQISIKLDVFRLKSEEASFS